MKMYPHNRKLLAALCLATGLLAACGNENATQDVAGQLERSRAYASQGQFKAALIESRNALETAPDSIEALLCITQIYNTLHYHSTAIQLLEPLKDHADPRVRLTLAQSYVLKGKLRSAASLLQTLPPNLPAEQARQKKLLDAEIALQRGEFDSTRELLRDMGDDADASLLLAQADMLQQRWAPANSQLQALAAKGNRRAQQLQASIASQSGELEKAEELLTNLLLALPETDILTPERATVLRELMQVVTRQGRPNEALVYAKILADSAPQQAQIEDKLREAAESYEKGDLATSRQLLTEVHNAAANKSVTGQALGVISFLQGDTAAAEQLLSTYIDPETAGKKALHMLAISQLNQNKPEALIELAQRERDKFDGDAPLQAFHGVALLMQGQRGPGMRALQRSIELDAKQVYAPMALARAHLMQKDKAQALQVLNDALAKNAGDKRLQAAIFGLHLQTGDTRAATGFIDGQLKQQPDAVNLLLLAGIAQQRAGDGAKAQATLEKARQLEPSNPDVTHALAQLALQQGQWAAAREQFTQLITLLPGRAVAYEGLLVAYHGEGKLEQGIAALEQVASNSDIASLPLAVLARQALSSGDTEKASRYATQAIKNGAEDDYVSQTFVQVMSTQARQALTNGNRDAARVATVRALEHAPANPDILALLAQIELQSDNLREAQKIAERLDKELPASTLGKLVDGDIKLKNGDASAALTQFRAAWEQRKSDAAAIRIHQALMALAKKQTPGTDTATINSFVDEWITALPASPAAQLRKAMQLQDQGTLDDAARMYEKLLAGNDNNVIALNNLAWIYLERSDKRALPAAERAFQLAPEDAAIADTYGWVLVQTGQTKEGIEILEKALVLKPDAEDIKAHLAQAKAGR